MGSVAEINNKKVKEGRGYTLQIFISIRKGEMVMMKKSTKIVGSLLTCGVLFLGGVHVQAMEGTSGDIKYYGHITNSSSTVDAGITTKNVRYPTAKAIVYWGKDGSTSKTGTSYATYCFVKANTPGNVMTSNKIHFTASPSFDLWTAAD